MGARKAALRHVEQFDDVVTARTECAQFEHQRFIHQANGRLVDRYLAGEIGIVLRQGVIGGSPWATNQYGFIWKAMRFGARAPKHKRRMQFDDLGVGADKPLMLSDDVEVVQGIKKRIPSFVRLQRFDGRDLSIGEPIFLFDVVQISGESALKLMNWEFSVSVRLYAVSLGEGSGDHIEGASVGIDDQSRFDIDERVERDFFSRHYELVRGIRIILEPEFIRVTTHPGKEALLQNWDLGYGPLDAGMSI